MTQISNKYTHIVFDIDGTLLDTEYAVLNSLQEVVEKMQHRYIDTTNLRFALGIPGKNAIDILEIDDYETAHVYWVKTFQKYANTIKLFDGIIPILNYLKDNLYTLGIITSKTREELKNDFSPFGITHFFDTIICAEDSIEHKPNAEPMKKFLEFSEATMEKVLYIGDTIYDRECAKGANVDFALALWGCNNQQNINPEYYLKHPNELKEILK